MSIKQKTIHSPFCSRNQCNAIINAFVEILNIANIRSLTPVLILATNHKFTADAHV